jgi:hypothetical protein
LAEQTKLRSVVLFGKSQSNLYKWDRLNIKAMLDGWEGCLKEHNGWGNWGGEIGEGNWGTNEKGNKK